MEERQLLSAVSGSAFIDYDNDGIREAENAAAEVGIAGIIVQAYGPNDELVGSTTTNEAGGYSLANPENLPLRIEFSVPGNFTDTSVGSLDGARTTNVVFLDGQSNTTVNYGVHRPQDVTDGDIQLVTTCYVFGDGANNANGGSEPAIITFDYTAEGLNPAYTTLATYAQVGSVSGLAYQRELDIHFAGAHMKRHAGFGPAGPGAIYYVEGDTAPAVLTTLPNAEDPHPTSTIGDATYINDWSVDGASFDRVGKMGLGDLDLSADGTTLWTVNLHDRRLYKIPVGTSDSPLDFANRDNADIESFDFISSILVDDANALGVNPAQNARPFGMGIRDGMVYLGIVNSAQYDANGDEGVLTAADLHAYVYRFDPANPASAPEQVLEFALNYERQAVIDASFAVYAPGGWNPWGSEWPDQYANGVAVPNFDFAEVGYAVPILSDIEFDNDGSMVLGFRDRFGDQGGNVLPRPDGTGANVAVDSGGDILRANFDSDSESWTLEALSYPFDPNNPPDSGDTSLEFYSGEVFGDSTFGATVHNETAQGNIAFVPGYSEVVTTAMDPIDNVAFSGGLIFLSNSSGGESGAGDRTQGINLFTSPFGDPASYAKANGLGDLEFVDGAASLEIGNRLWFDTNEDGKQTAAEPAVPNGVSVELFDVSNPGNPVLVGSTTTVNGEYYFNDGNVDYGGSDVGLKPFTDYEVRVAASNFAEDGLLHDARLTTPNAGADNIDSDAALVDGIPVITYTTGQSGTADHNLDIGFLRFDFGDLPNVYETTQESNGAWHVTDGVTFLGSGVDAETDGAPGTTATGDGSDEDGVSFDTPMTPGSTAQITVTASKAGYLNAWIDFNSNDVFDEGEQIADGVELNEGANVLAFSVPSNATGTMAARFRFTCDNPDLGPDGAWHNGEVEDYVLGSIGNLVWLDNGQGEGGGIDDGVQNGTEAGLAGVTVYLLNSENERVMVNGSPVSVVTNESGFYEFPGLPEGDYAVEIVATERELSPQDSASATDATDSDLSPVTGFSQQVTISPAVSIDTLDAGVVEWDRGDLLDGYHTLAGSNGAQHFLDGTTYLGSTVDADMDGQPSSGADGDGADEDGVTFNSPLIPGKNATITVNASKAGYLNAWIDFNSNGEFDEGEQIAADLSIDAGDNVLTIAVPSTATGTMAARFRFTCDDPDEELGPTGSWNNGEVEDYILGAIGDKVWLDNGAGTEGVGADGIQNGDEPPVQGVVVHLLKADETPVLDPDDTPVTTTTNGLGMYEFPGLPAGNYKVKFALPTGYQFTDQDADSDDASDSDANEQTGVTDIVPVEAGDDIKTVDAGIQEQDFGDLPDGYGTSTDQSGAVHGLDGATYLGDGVDAETDGAPNDAATGDGADEDGVVFDTPMVPGETAQITVTASKAGYLNAWIDFNSNGQFDDGERIASDLSVSAGANVMTFVVPEGAEGTMAARFRFTCDDPDGALGSTGPWDNGEVEDYVLGSIGDKVWEDNGAGEEGVSGDGVRNGEEPGVADVTVYLLNDEGERIINPATDEPVSTMTDASGMYEFAGLPAGNYAVEFIAPEKFAFTKQDAGDSDATDSDAGADGKTLSITIAPTDDVNTLDAGIVEYDFGDLPQGTILADDGARHVVDDVTFLGAGVDSDADGQPGDIADGDDATDDATDDEDGIRFLDPIVPGEEARIKVTAGSDGYLNAWMDLNNDGTLDEINVVAIDGEPYTGTLNDLSLTEGMHEITVQIPEAAPSFTTMRFRFTSDDPDGTLGPLGAWANGEVEDYVLLDVSGTLYADTNPDANFSDDDTPMADVTVTLYTDPNGDGNPEDGEVYAVTQTDENGYYEFQNNVPGPYVVVSDTVETYASIADVEGINNDWIAVDLVEDTVGRDFLDGTDTDGDFIADSVEGDGDRDGDGIPDHEDIDPAGFFHDCLTGQIIAGGSVSIVGPAAGSVNLIDDGADGSYQFFGLVPGIYTMNIALPDGYRLSPANLPQVGALDPTGQPDPWSIGSGEDATRPGFLTPGYVTDYWVQFDLDVGDPFIIDNNICMLPIEYDFGDLPDGYGTTDDEGGPKHMIDTMTYLGATWDFEDDGLPTDNATGDNADGANDEDGVRFLTPLTPGESADIEVTTSIDGYLNAWIDFNGDGTLNEVTVTHVDDIAQPADTKIDDLSLAEGVRKLTIAVPDEAGGEMAARFRYTIAAMDAARSTGGEFDNGEVEDYVLGSIGDFVWFDKDNDAYFDAEEEVGYPGVEVTLTGDADGDGVDEVVTTTTDEDGRYRFDGLPFIEWGVTITPPAGTMNTYDADGGLDGTSTITIDTSHVVDLDQDFGLKGTGSIGDTIFHDVNENGTQDADEIALPGVPVALGVDLDGDGDIDQTIETETDTYGKYLFENLPAGDYVVTMTPVYGLEPTTDHDGDDTPDVSSEVTLPAGGEDLTQDFGLVGPGSIGDKVFVDDDKDDGFDDGEGADSVHVVLTADLNDDGVLERWTTDTNADGDYLFDGLPVLADGIDYTVTVDTSTLPPDTVWNTVDPDGDRPSKSEVTLTDAEPENLLQDFGYIEVPHALLVSEKEQLMLEIVNLVRRDPAAAAAMFGIDLNDGLAAGTISNDPKQPLAPSALLSEAAAIRAAELIATDMFAADESGARVAAGISMLADLAGMTVGDLVSIGVSPFGPAGAFNVFVLGDMTSTNTDSAGRVAVGGDATLANFGVASGLLNPVAQPYSLMVGGTLTHDGGEVFKGETITGADVPIDFATMGDSLRAMSTELSALAKTHDTVVTDWKGIFMDARGSDGGLNVFELNVADLGEAVQFDIDADEGETVIVNVIGNSVDVSNFQMRVNGQNLQQGGTAPFQLLFNFPTAMNLSSTGFSWQGHVLAPNADYQFDNGHINGQLIVSNLSGTGEFHDFYFDGVMPATLPHYCPTDDVHALLFQDAERRAKLLDPENNEAGIAFENGTYTRFGMDFDSFLGLEVVEQTSDRYITGVMFNDSVADNDFYDIGEGVAHPTISAIAEDGTVHVAATAVSGGYAILVPPGTYTIVARHGTDEWSADGVDVSDDNVKVDFNTTVGAFTNLRFSLEAPYVSERETMVGRVTRSGTDIDEEYVVALSASEDLEVPDTVTIPAGKTSATFDITGKDDDLLEGVETAKIRLDGAASIETIWDVPIREIQRLIPSDADGGDNTGHAIAIDGDIAVVGARFAEVDGVRQSGAVYIYQRDSANKWVEIRKLEAPGAGDADRGGGDRFGSSVAVEGDTIIVGAPLDEAVGTAKNSGAVYVFKRDEGGANNWGIAQRIASSDSELGDQFGSSVVIEGGSVVIGARIADGEKKKNTGAVYIFENDGDKYVQDAVLQDLESTRNDQFGYVVDKYGDYVIVGAPFTDGETGVDSGTAYIFKKKGDGTWELDKKIEAPDTEGDVSGGDRFGHAVGIHGGIAVVGAYGEEDGRADLSSGAAYVFRKGVGDGWGQVARLRPEDIAIRDHFGFDVDISAKRIVVGSRLKTSETGTVKAGAAYVFERDGLTDNWNQIDKLEAFDSKSKDYAGSAVAISGDFAAVGAQFSDTLGGNSGTAYVYYTKEASTGKDPLLAASPVPESRNLTLLTRDELQPIVDAAVDQWHNTPLTAGQISMLHSFNFSIADLAGLRLGEADRRGITIDHDAAGHGWYIDQTPYDLTDDHIGSRMDLLTVVKHEIGHVLGLEDTYKAADSHELMYGFLSEGERRSVFSELDALFAGLETM